MKKLFNLLMCLLLTTTFISVDVPKIFAEANDCNWSSWGGDAGWTHSKPESCMPDLEHINQFQSVEIGKRFDFLLSDHFLVAANKEGLTCINTDNNQVYWKIEGVNVTNMTISNGFLYYISTKEVNRRPVHKLFCVNIEYSFELWSRDINMYSRSGLYVYNDVIYLMRYPDKLLRIDAKTGESFEPYEISIVGEYPNRIRFYNNFLVSVSRGYNFYYRGEKNREIACYEIDGFTKKWGVKLIDYNQEYLTCNISNNKVYVGFSFYYGYDTDPDQFVNRKILCLDINTGETIWKARFNGEFFETKAVNEDVIIGNIDDKLLICLDSNTGEEKWRKEFDIPDGNTILIEDQLFYYKSNGKTSFRRVLYIL